jgi:hypothetical protein
VNLRLPSRSRPPTPLRVVGRGTLAGYLGLAGMGVLVKGARAVRGGDGGPPRDWSEAEPPAKSAHRVIEPFWEDTLGRNVVDASFHLAFGLAVAYAYRELARRGI